VTRAQEGKHSAGTSVPGAADLVPDDIPGIRLALLNWVASASDEELLNSVKQYGGSDRDTEEIGHAGQATSFDDARKTAQELHAVPEHQTVFQQVTGRLRKLYEVLPDARMLMVGTTWVYAAATVLTSAVDPAVVPVLSAQVGVIGAAIGATAASAALRKADVAKHGHDDAPRGEPTGRAAGD
jgi:hypothetical protein